MPRRSRPSRSRAARPRRRGRAARPRRAPAPSSRCARRASLQAAFPPLPTRGGSPYRPWRMPRRRDPISQLETAIECLPRTTREAMLEGIRTRPIIAGAYTDNHGGICPMLAAHRGGGRTSLLSFARSWDAFARAKRVRRATRRELRVLEDLLVASLESETDLGAAIAAHRASAASRPEVVDEPQQPQRGEGLGEEVIRARRGGAVVSGPVGEAGEHDDRGVGGDGGGAQPPAGPDAAAPPPGAQDRL